MPYSNGQARTADMLFFSDMKKNPWDFDLSLLTDVRMFNSNIEGMDRRCSWSHSSERTRRAVEAKNCTDL